VVKKELDAYKKGGYNTPTQNALPKRFMGGDDPMGPSGMTRANISSPDISNPFVKSNPLTDAMTYKPSVTARPSATTSVVPTPAPVSVIPTPTPVPAAEPSFREKKKAMKEQGKLERLEAKNDLKKAKIENLKKQFESGDRKAATSGDKIDRALKVGETVIGGINAVNQLRKPIGGGSDPFEQKRGGSIKTKMKSGGAKPKAMYGMSMKPGMMKKGGAKKK
jgi:hypothetical protein